jgi:hypothetical protein
MNPLYAWNRFWFSPISARPLGTFRIAFGLMVLTHLGLISVDLDFWYTGVGLLQGDEARLAAGDLRLSPLIWFQDPLTVRLAMGALAVTAAAFTLGWHTKVMSVLLYLGLLSFYHRNISTNCGPDMVMMITSFYLMLSPCGAAFSLDARRLAARRGTAADPLIFPWAQRLIQCQMCVIYFNTAFLKCQGTTWGGGTAIHFVIYNHEFGQFNLEWLAGYPLVINVMCHAALMLEFGLAFLLWFRPTRRWVALAGLMLHVGIVPLVNVPLFGELMVAMYLLFLEPDELDALLQAVDPRRWLASKKEPASPAAKLPGRVDLPSQNQGPHLLARERAGVERATATTFRGNDED